MESAPFLQYTRRGSLFGRPSNFQRSANLERDDPQQFQNDEDDGDNDQSMDPAACLREAWAYAPTEKAK
jgi:hypothetical protein